MFHNKLRKGERRSIGNLRQSPRTSVDVAHDEGRFPDSPSSPRSPNSAVHPELNHPTLVTAPSQDNSGFGGPGYEDQETLHIRLRDEAARRAAAQRERSTSIGTRADSVRSQGSPTSLRYGHAKSLSTGSDGLSTSPTSSSWYMTTGVKPRASVNDDTRARKYNSIYRASGLSDDDSQPKSSGLVYSPSTRTNRTTDARAYARDNGASYPTRTGQEGASSMPASPVQASQPRMSSQPQAANVPLVPTQDPARYQQQGPQERSPQVSSVPFVAHERKSSLSNARRPPVPAFEVPSRGAPNNNNTMANQQPAAAIPQSQLAQRSSSLSPAQPQQNESRFTEQFSEAGTLKNAPGAYSARQQAQPVPQAARQEEQSSALPYTQGTAVPEQSRSTQAPVSGPGAAAIAAPIAALATRNEAAERDVPMQSDEAAQAGLSSRDFVQRGNLAQEARSFPTTASPAQPEQESLGSGVPPALAAAPRQRHPSGPREISPPEQISETQRENILAPPPPLRRLSTDGGPLSGDEDFVEARETMTPGVDHLGQQLGDQLVPSYRRASPVAAEREESVASGLTRSAAEPVVKRTPTFGPEHQTTRTDAPQRVLATKKSRYTDAPTPTASFAAPTHPQYSSLPTNIASKIPHYMFVKYEATVCQECVDSDQRMHAISHGGQRWKHVYADPEEEQPIPSDDPNTTKTGRKEYTDSVHLAKPLKGGLGEPTGQQCQCDRCVGSRDAVRRAAEMGILEQVFDGRKHPLSETITTTTYTTIVRAPIIEETEITVPCEEPNCPECLKLAEEHRKAELSDLLENKLRGMVVHRTGESDGYDADNMWLDGSVDDDGSEENQYLRGGEYEGTGLNGMSKKMHLLLSRAGNPRQEKLRSLQRRSEGSELAHSSVVGFDEGDMTSNGSGAQRLFSAPGTYYADRTDGSAQRSQPTETGMREMSGDTDGYSLREQQQASDRDTIDRRTIGGDTASTYSQA